MRGGALGSPGLLFHPSLTDGVRVVADTGPREFEVFAEMSIEGRRTFIDFERVRLPDEDVRRVNA